MKTIQGNITSLKNDKTAIVTVSGRQLHPLYKKYVKSTKKYAAHYEDMALELGQEVVITECRPISKTKKFKVTKIVSSEIQVPSGAQVDKK
ncbi:MAG: 30S ribosomal protein S17 [Candidatus Pacebacteria bacterium]|nr:30S ribosomal protein S17 [Candidatus Paceibacterota bacterium]